MAVQGHIDQVSAGHIFGWAWNDEAPTSTRTVVAMVNGKRIASGQANVFREDLQRAGIGDGRHGFQLSIPAVVLKNSTIRIVDAESQGEIGAVSMPDQGEGTGHASLRLVMDITDILLFLDRHHKLTGIPRVQIEILRAIFVNGLFELDRIEFVALSYATRKFESVDKNDLFTVIDRRLGGRGVDQGDGEGLYHVERHLAFKPFNPDVSFCGTSVFVALGSPWGIPDFFVRVNELLTKGMRLAILYHDIIPLARPDLSTPEMTDLFHLFVRSSFLLCDTLMAVSEHCARDTEHFAKKHGYHCPPIYVLGNGATDVSAPVGEKSLPEPYVLVVSTIEKRKNHLALAKAWQKLLGKHGAKLPKLVFVGSFGLDIQPLFDFLRDTSSLDGHVQILHNVSDERLGALYRDCLFTAYPSLYEGWGLPVTESLAFGKVCLCSQASALPEAGQDFCVYFHPEDVDAIVEQAEKLIFDAEYRRSLELRIAEEYTPPQWAAIGEKLIAKMREVGEKPHRDAPPVPIGEEVAFWLPQPYPEQKEQVYAALANFSRGYLTDKPLTWDNYCMASALVTSGRLFPRSSTGWEGDPTGNAFSIMPASGADISRLNLYLLIGVSGKEQSLKIYCANGLVENVDLRPGLRLIRLKARDFAANGKISLVIRGQESITYKSLLLLSEDDVGARLTLQEKLGFISAF